MRRMGMSGRMGLVTGLLAPGSAPGGAGGRSSAKSDIVQRFIGTWRLISIESNGQPDPRRGPHPTGLIHYDGTGHMAVQIMPDRSLRPKFAGVEPTPEEARAALSGYSAYFGTYSIDETAATVTHHREGNINPGGLGDFVRRYQFEGDDRVILMPRENQNRLTWERVK
jgi:hypothetical protein